VQVAAACGVRVIHAANTPHIVSISSIKSLSFDCLPAEATNAAYLGVFIALPAQDAYKCSRCPSLAANTSYTVYLAATEASSAFSGTAVRTEVLRVRTAKTPSAPRLLFAPEVAAVDSSSITLSFRQQPMDRSTIQAFGVAYVVTYARLSAPFFPGYILDFPIAQPSAEDVIAYARLGGAGTLISDDSALSPTAAPTGGAEIEPDEHGYYGRTYGAFAGTYGAREESGVSFQVDSGEKDARTSRVVSYVSQSQDNLIGGLGGVVSAGYIETSGASICCIKEQTHRLLDGILCITQKEGTYIGV
jgi:hypothetical protein